MHVQFVTTTLLFIFAFTCAYAQDSASRSKFAITLEFASYRCAGTLFDATPCDALISGPEWDIDEWLDLNLGRVPRETVLYLDFLLEPGATVNQKIEVGNIVFSVELGAQPLPGNRLRVSLAYELSQDGGASTLGANSSYALSLNGDPQRVSVRRRIGPDAYAPKAEKDVLTTHISAIRLPAATARNTIVE